MVWTRWTEQVFCWVAFVKLLVLVLFSFETDGPAWKLGCSMIVLEGGWSIECSGVRNWPAVWKLWKVLFLNKTRIKSFSLQTPWDMNSVFFHCFFSKPGRQADASFFEGIQRSLEFFSNMCLLLSYPFILLTNSKSFWNRLKLLSCQFLFCTNRHS